MASKMPIVLFALLFSNAMAWESIQAGYKEDCSSRICDEFKDFACSDEKVCECKMDPEINVPWIYTEEFDKCFPAEPKQRAAGASAMANTFGARPSPRCTTINDQCDHTNKCQRIYGNLASCHSHPLDPALNRCQCCDAIKDVGFFNKKCYYVREIGETCQADEECLLTALNTECLRGVCAYRNQGGNTGSGSQHGSNHGHNHGRNGGRPVFSTSFSLVLVISAVVTVSY